MGQLLLDGLQSVLTPSMVLVMILGCMLGVIFGSLPGLNSITAVVLVMPIIFTMDMMHGLALILGIYNGGASGGLVAAILINIPGTPQAMATTFDGHPMAQKGEAGKALGAGIVFSFLGGLFSMIILIMIAPQLAKITMQFSSVEYFAATVFSMTMIAGLSGKSLIKGLISGLMGIMFSLVGLSPIDGTPRFTFGSMQLLGGLNMTVVLLAVFAIPEIMEAVSAKNQKAVVNTNFKIRGFGFSFREFREQVGNFFRSAVIGTFVGILPGIGGSTASPLAYMVSRMSSKHPEKYGTGIIDGVVASETANNATIGGAMVPLLTLGIPGDMVTALMLGVLNLYGLNPGPLLFTTNADVIYMVFVALIVCNVIVIALEFFGMRAFLKLMKMKKHYLLPIIGLFCIVGAFSSNNRIFDIICLVVFGFVGYGIRLLDLPLAPLVIGFVLGPMFETNLRRGLMFMENSFWAFFTRPIALGFFIATLAAIVIFLILARKQKNM